MNKDVKRTIDDLANMISKIVSIPKDNRLSESLKKIGIDVRYFIDKRYDAFLQWNYDKDCPVISVNANQPIVRRNFSLAHELGHLVIDYKWMPFEDNSNIPNKNVLSIKYRGGIYTTQAEKNDETIVNEFAGAFLVPNRLIKDEINNHDLDYISMIIHLSEKYKVSKQVAKIRLDNYLDGV